MVITDGFIGKYRSGSFRNLKEYIVSHLILLYRLVYLKNYRYKNCMF